MQILRNKRFVTHVFDGVIHADFGAHYLIHGDITAMNHLLKAYAGQSNGLCGAAVPELIVLQIGTHTGPVALTIDLHEIPPAVDERWEDIVEVSFEAVGETLELADLGSCSAISAPLPPGSYRVRYHARGMDRGADVIVQGETAEDDYHLDFWLAAPAPDAIIKQTSKCAAYWHDTVKRPS